MPFSLTRVIRKERGLVKFNPIVILSQDDQERHRCRITLVFVTGLVAKTKHHSPKYLIYK